MMSKQFRFPFKSFRAYICLRSELESVSFSSASNEERSISH